MPNLVFVMPHAPGVSNAPPGVSNAPPGVCNAPGAAAGTREYVLQGLPSQMAMGHIWP
jgi:hypothetical protein